MKSLTRVIFTVLILTAVVVLGRREDFAQVPKGVKNRVKITTEGDFRLISSNGIPDHEPGRFPNRNNPNVISEQRYEFRMLLKPRVAEEPTVLGFNPFGVAVNGVVFDPSAAEFWRGDRQSGWQYEAMGGAIDLGVDKSHAHVQPNGAYHYHGIPTALVARLSGGKKQMTLVGYAADGFPIYASLGFADPKSADSEVRKMKSSYQVKKGMRPDGPRGRYDGSFVQDYEYIAGAGDLDDCNGREGVTPEFPDGTYHYFLTEAFPFIPRYLRGTPDESFRRRGPGGGGPPPGGPGGRPPGPPPRKKV